MTRLLYNTLNAMYCTIAQQLVCYSFVTLCTMRHALPGKRQQVQGFMCFSCMAPEDNGMPFAAHQTPPILTNVTYLLASAQQM